MRVWLKLDSGMHRVGLLPDEFVEADRLLAKQPGIRELIHMTHFSSASTPPASVMEQQLSCFLRCRRTDSKAKVSLANSAALFARNDTHADWARPGIALYGVNPLGADNHVSLRAVMSFRTYVIAARKIGVGEAVGYNERWRSVRPSRIGTLGVGYGDGYPRHARVGTPIWIKGHRVPLVGQVSMDSMMVDLTDRDDVEIGDEAVLWGPELPAAAVAECADTISYELFTSLQRRVTRVYSEVPTGHRVPN
jgi:alanine racemase